MGSENVHTTLCLFRHQAKGLFRNHYWGVESYRAELPKLSHLLDGEEGGYPYFAILPGGTQISPNTNYIGDFLKYYLEGGTHILPCLGGGAPRFCQYSVGESKFR